MAAQRRAQVVWGGSLEAGRGVLDLKSSGAVSGLPVTWASRTQRSEGMTSPEELIAAAHASCFAMELSFQLTQIGPAPEKLDVTVTCTIDQVDGGWRVTASAIEVEGVVPGLDEASFVQAAERAKDGCPVSGALKGNLEITVQARLAQN
jgi:osmotically inducible protein OsmC